MNLTSSARVEFETLRFIGFAAIGAGFAGIGTVFGNPGRLIKITNDTDVNVLISFNGIDNQDIVPAYGFCLYDLCSNKSDAAGYLEMPASKRVYVKAETALPTLGNVYVTYMYASQV